MKGITIEIGGNTTGLDKALSGVNKNINSTKSDLKDVERLLKLDPKNTELLSQKFKLLSGTVDDTEKKLDALKEAEKQVQEQVKKGKVSEEQYDALKREIIATENSLENLREEAKKTESALNGIDDDSLQDISKAADDVRDSMKDAEKGAVSFGDVLKAGAIIEGGKAIVSSLKDIAEESKEYTKIMASLEVSSEAAGYSAKETSNIYNQLYGVLGDEQSAATTTANLQAIGLSQEQLVKVTNGAIGAWAKYGDSIPIDGLAEAINETIKVGQVTGNFADVLKWAGVSEDAFNEQLATITDRAERAKLVINQLTKQGLIEAGKAWQNNNKALVENNKANAKLQGEIAELGQTVMPVITKVIDKISELLEWFNGLDSQTQTIILTVLSFVAALGVLQPVINGISSAISFLAANPIVLLIAAIAAVVAAIATFGDDIQKIIGKVDKFLQKIFSTDWTEMFGAAGEIVNGLFKNMENVWNAIKNIFNGIIDFIRGVFTGDWKRAWEGIKSIFKGIWDSLVTVIKAPINLIIGIINAMIGGIEYAVNGIISAVNKLSFTVPDWVPGIGGEKFGFNMSKVNMGDIPYLANGGDLYRGSAVVGEAGPELLTMMGNHAVVQPLTNHTTTSTSYGDMQFIIYGAPGQDVEELAEIVSEKVSDITGRRESAYA